MLELGYRVQLAHWCCSSGAPQSMVSVTSAVCRVKYSCQGSGSKEGKCVGRQDILPRE